MACIAVSISTALTRFCTLMALAPAPVFFFTPTSFCPPLSIGTSVSRHRRASRSSASQRVFEDFHSTEEDMQVGIPGQDSVYDLPSCLDDLGRDAEEGVNEPLELHPQDRPLLLAVLLPPSPLHRQEERQPRLQSPGQGGHHHVGPVADQVVDRHLHRTDPALELRDKVLLVA